MVYLFIGDDQFSKDIKLDKIKEELFLKEFEAFNFDILYARELDLVKLQEALLRLPFKAKQRLILIKEAFSLKEPIKEYLLSYLKKNLNPSTLLILDIERLDKKDAFLNKVVGYSKVFRFKESPLQDTFQLSDEINNKRINTSLKILRGLLLSGTRPEKIMGGLRYCWENSYLSAAERKKRLNLLLNCDIEIKTGKAKPEFVLERLLIRLCCF